MKLHSLLFLLTLLPLLLSCSQSSVLDEIIEHNNLIVLTINSPTSYYYDRDDELAGPEYELTQAFAKHLGVEVEYRSFDSTTQVIDALRQGQGHLAAAGLTVNDTRKQEFDFGPVYLELDEELICHRTQSAVETDEEMASLEITVAADSSYVDTLASLKDVSFQADAKRNTQQLLEAVARRKLQCTVSDSTLFDIERRYLTSLESVRTLSEGSEIAWMLNRDSDALRAEIEEWFESYREASLPSMLDRYYGFVEIFDYVDTHKFLRRASSRLEKYKKWFIDAAKQNDIDPVLLAAQSYQESHWNPKAKSPTGVRGIMMLTQPVAKSLGVKSRLDARSNIYAGARFHARMKKMVEHVAEPDRTWLALAAYNVGRGHFRDAQSLARKLGKDPDSWSDMKQVLPLLSEKKYYKDLRYGYARGNEPVTYVRRIRNYERLLYRHFEGL